MSAKRLMQVLLRMSRHAGSTGGQCRCVSPCTLTDFLLNFFLVRVNTVLCISVHISVVFEWDEGKWVVNKREGKPVELEVLKIARYFAHVRGLFNFCTEVHLGLQQFFLHMQHWKDYFECFCSSVQKAFWGIFPSWWRVIYTARCLLSNRKVQCKKLNFFHNFVTLQHIESTMHILHP